MSASRTGPILSRASIALGASSLLLGGAAVMLGTASFTEQTELTGTAAAWAFGLATAAALIRNGIFPFHSWVVAAFDEPNEMLPAAALLSAQSGAFLVARLAPVMPQQMQLALPAISDLALISALLMAFLAIGESARRRTLGLIAASQSAILIAGLEIRNVEGITGALVHSFVVAAGVGGLAAIYRALYARCGDSVDERFAGLGARAPRLKVFFLVFALALVGLPGTLGFAAEDLLFHGALETHPALGVALPLATALSAIALLRLYAHIFVGKRNLHVPPVSDARLGERIACTVLLVFLIGCGLYPAIVIDSRSAPATRIAEALGEARSHARR
jgi:NADH-quinone oxidoreductase subunit M